MTAKAAISEVYGVPEYMLNKDGSLQSFLPHMDVSQGQVHLLCPAGIGDVAWLWAKMWKVHEDLKEQGRELIWHFPETGSNRIAGYAKLVGMNVGCYISQMQSFRDFPEISAGPRPEDFETGGAFYIHANMHIEAGNPLHVNSPKFMMPGAIHPYDERGHFTETWCPWLPYKIPVPPVHEMNKSYRGHGWNYNDVKRFTGDTKPYIIVKMGSTGWMGFNWPAKTYAKVIQKLEEIAPVMLMGYTPCQEDFLIERVIDQYMPHGGFCIDQSYESALTAVINCSAMLSIDDGMSIMATYYGIDCFRMYPDWLHKMPGTWEDVSTLHPHNTWCLIEDIKDGPLDEWIAGVKV